MTNEEILINEELEAEGEIQTTFDTEFEELSKDLEGDL